MNDRFKFRVAIDNKIYPVFSILFPNQFQVFIDGELKTYSLKDFPLMLYTGLNDKNGKLIYEGDIVSTVKYNRPFSSNAKSKNILEIVYWLEEYYQFSTKNIEPDYKFTHSFGGIKNSEIIGNIHENLELLAK